MKKYKSGQEAKIGDKVRLVLPEGSPVASIDYVVCAINQETPKFDGRGVDVKVIHAMPVFNIESCILLERDGQEMSLSEVESVGGQSALRTDGPTVEQYVEAGYDKQGYPPKGYAPKPSPGYDALLKERESKVKESSEAEQKAKDEAAEKVLAGNNPPA